MASEHGITFERSKSGNHLTEKKDPMAPAKKRIIIACDGTWKSADSGDKEAPTNVTRLVRAIKAYTEDLKGEKYTDKNGNTVRRGIAQICYYQAGVGTTGGVVSKLVGGATGDGLLENIRAAYGFLAHNYSIGDELYFIGFSRGAFTARAIAGLVTSLGILTKTGMNSFYNVFRDYSEGKFLDKAVLDSYRNQGPHFVVKDVTVKAVGVFDTVGSLGIPDTRLTLMLNSVFNRKTGDSKYAFYNTNVSPKVENAFQALALDENRISFYPTLWTHTPETLAANVNLKQVWFPGVHTNIGGGYDNQELADLTLAWMISELSPFLEFDWHALSTLIQNPESESAEEWAMGKLYNSATGIYRFEAGRTRQPGEHMYAATGAVQTNESIHPSVRIRMQETLKKANSDKTKKLKPWTTLALAGWNFVQDKESGGWYWEKPAPKNAKNGAVMRLPETEIGTVEMELAGKRVVETYLGQDAWKKVSERVWSSMIAEGVEGGLEMAGPGKNGASTTATAAG